MSSNSLTPGHCVLSTFPWKKKKMKQRKNNDGQKSLHRGPSALPGSRGTDLLVTLTVRPISLNGSARWENPPAPGQGRHVLSPWESRTRPDRLQDSISPLRNKMQGEEVRKRETEKNRERHKRGWRWGGVEWGGRVARKKPCVVLLCRKATSVLPH